VAANQQTRGPEVWYGGIRLRSHGISHQNDSKTMGGRSPCGRGFYLAIHSAMAGSAGGEDVGPTR